MKVAILGLGTVGFGVYDIINKSEYLKDVKVKAVLDKDLSKQKDVNADTVVTDNYDDILNDKEISVIVETMGAKGFSYQCIKKALENKKSVVTANKEVIAEHIDELTELKNKNNVCLYYEASVGGGIPIINPLFQASKVNDIASVNGILNGTTNFILTKMSAENYTFADALKLAQEKGFAEADPTADLEGLDMVRKITILSCIAYNGFVDLNKVYHYGIGNVSKEDIDFLKKYNYTLKFVASSIKQGNSVSLSVEPTVLPSSNVISMTNNEFNIVSVDCDYNGELMFYGKGAGRYPTANAIVNDLMMIMENGQKGNYSFNNKNQYEVKTIDEKNKYYLRLKENVNIASDLVLEKENNCVITKEILRSEFLKLIDSVEFYGKVK